MLFKRLEIIGFKSFGDKTVFEFEPGITTIVGPNGCGKSNVADAIRWVLGEQSAKALRGGRMEDVIFNGTDERPPINLAEVSFTLEDPEKNLPIGFHEVTVTRRVFRDGQGEYFINKAACRLRDIHELFMGTGIGTDAYSILEQGKMDLILNAKPQERREIFEEAAGITKFEAKKTEALRKLESTEENLVRVHDIIKEVKRQIHSVQRYAAKARHYRKLFDEMKDLQIAYSRHRYGEVSTALALVQEDLEKTYKAQKEKSMESGEAQAQMDLMREDLRAQSGLLEELRDEAARLENEISRRESQYKLDEDRLSELTKSQARWESEVQEHREKIGKFEQALVDMRSQVHQLTDAVAATREDIRTRDEAIRNVQEKIRVMTQEQNRQREQFLEEELNATRAKNEMGDLVNSCKTAVVKRERRKAERESLLGRCSQLEEVLHSARQEILGHQERTAKTRQELAGLGNACREIQEKIVRAQEQSEVVREELAQKKAQSDLLAEWKSEQGNWNTATRVILNKRREDPSSWQGLWGTIFDLMQVEEGYAAAVEAVVGAHCEDLVVEADQWVEKIRAVLVGEGSGRVRLLSIEGAGGRAQSNLSLLEDSRIVGPLGRFVQFDARIAERMRPLVERTYVVRTWEDALSLAGENRGKEESPSFVSLQGEYIQGTGRFLVGSGANRSPRALIRDEETKKISGQIEHLEELLHDTIVNKGGLVVDLEEQKKKASELEKILRDQEIQQATLQNELDKQVLQRDQLSGDQSIVQRELEEIQREEEGFAQGHHRYQCILQDFEKNQGVRKAQLDALAKELEEYSQTRETMQEEVTHKKIQLACLEEKLENHTMQRQGLSERLAELGSLYVSKESDAKETNARIAQLQSELAQWKSAYDVLTARRDGRQEVLQETQKNRQRTAARCDDLERTLSQARSSLAELAERQRELEVQRAQLEAQRDNFRENLYREFQVDLQTSFSPQQDMAIAPDSSQDSFGGNWDALQERVAELRKMLENMGSVNLAALEEHDELQSRYDFLVQQHEDLVQGKQTLLKVISKINTTTRKLFADTFALVRMNFQEIFVKLFGGGKADLLLTDEGDILETGIEIVAKPPGKQLRSISLLSGGEKALTAIALLFAVFQVKPSPFCILDEIDAPLDESNIVRFVRMLQEYAQKTQFIVITHNKRTIAESDILYGITMQESGISKVVSVRLADAQVKETRAASPAAADARDGGFKNRVFRTPLFRFVPQEEPGEELTKKGEE